jgi:hypothetical protein
MSCQATSIVSILHIRFVTNCDIIGPKFLEQTENYFCQDSYWSFGHVIHQTQESDHSKMMCKVITVKVCIESLSSSIALVFTS